MGAAFSLFSGYDAPVVSPQVAVRMNTRANGDANQNGHANGHSTIKPLPILNGILSKGTYNTRGPGARTSTPANKYPEYIFTTPNRKRRLSASPEPDTPLAESTPKRRRGRPASRLAAPSNMKTSAKPRAAKLEDSFCSTISESNVSQDGLEINLRGIDLKPPAKPAWMNDAVYETLRKKTPAGAKECPGCGEWIIVPKAIGKTVKGLQYYIHTIQECKEYKKLGLITKCNKCKGTFPDPRSYNNHGCRKFPNRK